MISKPTAVGMMQTANMIKLITKSSMTLTLLLIFGRSFMFLRRVKETRTAETTLTIRRKRKKRKKTKKEGKKREKRPFLTFKKKKKKEQKRSRGKKR